jgi:WD40 repeat protein
MSKSGLVHRKIYAVRRLSIILWFLLLAGCGTGSEATPTQTETVAVNSPTIFPTPTSTSAPTATPTPTPTNTTTPTLTPVIPANGGIITEENASKLELMETWGKGKISRMEWLLDGTLLVVQTEYGVYVYDPSNWAEQASWPGADALDVSKNGKTLGIGFGKGSVIIWDAETKISKEINQGYDRKSAQKWSNDYQVKEELNGTIFLPDVLALTDDGVLLAIAGRDARIGFWDTRYSSLLGYMTSAASPPSVGAEFSANARRLVTGDNRGNMVVWDVVNQKALKLLSNAGSFSGSPFSPDASRLVTFMGSAILIWDSTSGALLSRWATNLDWVSDAFYSEDGNYVIINDYQQIRRVSDGWQVPLNTIPKPEEKPLPDPSPLTSTEFVNGGITGVALGKDDFPLAWGVTWEGAEAGSLWWWRIVSKQITIPDWSHCEDIGVGFSFGTKAISPDCTMTAEAVGNIFNLYRTADHSILHNLAAHTQDISVVVFSPGGKYFASGTSARYDNELILWRVDRTVGLWKMNSGISSITAIAFSADETMLAVASEKLRLWRTTDHLLLGVLMQSSLALAFSPDGKILAVANFDTSISLISVKHLSVFAVLRGSWNRVTALAFTPDGTGLLGGTYDGTVRLWGIPTEGK